jgi:hypothetical protein
VTKNSRAGGFSIKFILKAENLIMKCDTGKLKGRTPHPRKKAIGRKKPNDKVWLNVSPDPFISD